MMSVYERLKGEPLYLPHLSQAQEQLSCQWVTWAVGFIAFEQLVGKYSWNICACAFRTFHTLLYVVQAQPTPETGKPVYTCSTLCDKMVCQLYRQCTSCSCRSRKSQLVEWVFSVKGGLSVLADGRWWRKREWGGGFRVNTHTHKHKDNGPILKARKTIIVVHKDVSAHTFLCVSCFANSEVCLFHY